ncbi:uncharacterized mitochondrial protein AtMg01250-like [Vicia villosa]|uniref:uncharacterized mitochondrial protein AtMg01250-like n=1 Tax=Vicia villosa TaxID=3911 RepID=UPI00273B18AD|nr:uncharacterized mitochondrial protein AtMg01250-like [Vicia villosa]
MDGILVTNEIIDYAKRYRKDYFMFKVDFSQAYDCVDWNYLRSILRKVGFGIRWMKWLEAWVFSSSMSVLENGSPTQDFMVSRELRQGDPLSPFLFALAAEGLTRIMNQAVLNGVFTRFSLGNNISFSLLQFADDTIIVGNASWCNLWTLKSILHGFKMMSGLSINMSKSKVYGVGIETPFLNATSKFLSC